MNLDPQTILRIDRARLDGLTDSDIMLALEDAGQDAARIFNEYMRTPLRGGRLRGEVYLADYLEDS
jgi:hypothetical protein